MDNRKYFFVGARFYCLEKMLNLKLNIVCKAVMKDSFAQKGLDKLGESYVAIESKAQLLDLINNTDFDVLVSNGCPYILPISKLNKGNQKFINIHPSLLPDLRGITPINGSILFDRPQGVTCHYMDDGVDTGAIISQIKITEKPVLPLDLLYQLSFKAEGDAFEAAYNKDFEPIKEKKSLDGTIYFSRKDSDMTINTEDDMNTIIHKVKAFQVDGQYARIYINDNTYLVKDVFEFNALSLDANKYEENEIVHIYGNNVVTKKNNEFVLWRLDNTNSLNIGDKFI